jgi:hypothetical protein
MKIEQGGIVITEVPGIASIELRPDGITVLDVGQHYGIEFTLEEATQLRDALNVIIEHADRAERPEMPEQKTAAPRTWRLGDEQPEGVTTVTDSDGDRWDLHDGSFWHLRGGSDFGARNWSEIMRSFGPLAEYRPTS